MDIEILNWSTRVTTTAIQPETVKPNDSISFKKAQATHTLICDKNGSQVEAGVYHRHELNPGDGVDGPALIIEPQTTTLVSQDFSAVIDAAYNIILTCEE